MPTLGLRCSNTDYTFAVIQGTKMRPKVLVSDLVKYPKGFDNAAILRWFSHEIDEILNRYSPSILAIKTAESNAKRTLSLDARLRIEGVALMLGAAKGCKSSVTKVNPTIAKDLGFKGRGKYLQTKLDVSVIDGFDAKPAKIQEAILVGWSCLD